MLLATMLQAFQDIPNGWATVGAAVIDVGGPVLIAVVGGLMAWVLRRLKQVQRHAEAAADGVTNQHETNLRDDLDGKQDETRGLLTEAIDKLAQIQKVQVDQARDIGGIRSELRQLHESDAEQVRQANRDRERMDQLERTIPRDALGRFVSRSDG